VVLVCVPRDTDPWNEAQALVVRICPESNFPTWNTPVLDTTPDGPAVSIPASSNDPGDQTQPAFGRCLQRRVRPLVYRETLRSDPPAPWGRARE
jgi:hypothetical protein